MQNEGNLISPSEGSSSASTSTGDNIKFALAPVGNSSPTQFTDFPSTAENRAASSSDQPQQDLAFLEDSNPLPEIPEAIKGIPPAIFKFFGDTIQELDEYGRRQWLRKTEEPNCKPGTFAFCCNLGAPNPGRVQSRYPEQGQKTTADEILRRRRKCSKCTFDNMPLFLPEEFFFHLGNVLIYSIFERTGGPAVLGCLFTANTFCCSCKDRVRTHIYVLISKRKISSRSKPRANLTHN